MRIALRTILAARSIASCILWVGLATSAAHGQGAPSLEIPGSLLSQLETAYNASHLRTLEPQSPSAATNFIVEVRGYNDGIEAMFAPSLAGKSEFISVRSRGPTAIAKFSPGSSAVPLVLPGIVVIELNAILNYSEVNDEVQKRPWFSSGTFDVSIYIGSAMLVVTFAPRQSQSVQSNLKCLSGCGQSTSYYLRVDKDRFVIQRVVTL